MLTHLLLTPFYNVPHRLTSFALCFCILCLIHKGFKLNFRCERFGPVIRDTQAGDAILSLESTHQPADDCPWHAAEGHGIDDACCSFFDQLYAFTYTEDRLTLEGGVDVRTCLI